jgi:SAM-dependent methyltransferase
MSTVDAHLTRFAMYRALSNVLARHDGADKRCLAISRSARLAQVLGLLRAEIIETTYPETTLLALPFAAAEFDFCVSDQVLHHVEGDPVAAVRESLRVVRPSGFAVHTTCFVNPASPDIGDYWRFSPEALALLCRLAGGEVVSTGRWGNKEALSLVQLGLNRLKVPLDPAHSLHRIATANDPRWPIVTWIVARKPAGKQP